MDDDRYILWTNGPRGLEPRAARNAHDAATMLSFYDRIGRDVEAIERGGEVIERTDLREAFNAIAEAQAAAEPRFLTHCLYMKPPHSDEFVLADKATSRERLEKFVATHYPTLPSDRYEIREAQ